MEYSIIEMEEKILYGKGIKTNYISIKNDAPEFFKKMSEIYEKKYGEINYGMIVYESRFDSNKCEYWIAYDKEISEFERTVLPKSKWLKLKINSQNAKDIQKTSEDFYCKFVPSSKYKLKSIPELEYYHDNITEFLIAIED